MRRPCKTCPQCRRISVNATQTCPVCQFVFFERSPHPVSKRPYPPEIKYVDLNSATAAALQGAVDAAKVSASGPYAVGGRLHKQWVLALCQALLEQVK